MQLSLRHINEPRHEKANNVVSETDLSSTEDGCRLEILAIESNYAIRVATKGADHLHSYCEEILSDKWIKERSNGISNSDMALCYTQVQSWYKSRCNKMLLLDKKSFMIN